MLFKPYRVATCLQIRIFVFALGTFLAVIFRFSQLIYIQLALSNRARQ